MKGFELIGHVSIETGTLVLGDPWFFENDWKKEKECSPTGMIRFWGASAPQALKIIKSAGYTATLTPDTIPETWSVMVPGEEVNLWEAKLHQTGVMTTIVYDNSTLSHVFEKVDRTNADIFKFDPQNANSSARWAVCRTGDGDGVYPVYVRYRNGRPAEIRVVFD